MGRNGTLEPLSASLLSFADSEHAGRGVWAGCRGWWVRAKVLAAVAGDSPLFWQEAYAPLSTALGRRDFRFRNFYIKYLIDGRSLHFSAPPRLPLQAKPAYL